MTPELELGLVLVLLLLLRCLDPSAPGPIINWVKLAAVSSFVRMCAVRAKGPEEYWSRAQVLLCYVIYGPRTARCQTLNAAAEYRHTEKHLLGPVIRQARQPPVNIIMYFNACLIIFWTFQYRKVKQVERYRWREANSFENLFSFSYQMLCHDVTN